ncbi:MAG TPA: aminotransferase class V-fold PLP-dependent enzyme, partial [Candidatus Kapabacteria bacterium]
DRRTFLKMSLTTTATIPARKNGLRASYASTHRDAIEPAISRSTFATRKLAADEKYWNTIRAEFPIMENILYLNNGTMGPSPRQVTDRVTDRIRHVDATGDYSGDYEAIRTALAHLVNAESGDQIAFTHNVSEAISIVSSGIELKAGDEVILTDQEHAGNAVPWLTRKKRDGIEIKFASITNGASGGFAPYSDDEILHSVEQTISSRTRAICVPHLTCTTGQLLPIKRIAELARSRGIWMIADGAHPPGMLMTDVRDLGVHAYASCGHKWLCGPKGIGFLYIAPDFLEHVIPTWSGAEADQYWGYDAKLDFLPTASRYDFATQNFGLFDGLQCAIEFMQTIGLDHVQSRVQYLTGLLRSGLHELSAGKFRFLTPETSLTGVTTIKLDTMDYKDFANKMMAKCKARTRVVPEGNLQANRFSVHIYTSPEDIGKFLDGAKAVLAL